MEDDLLTCRGAGLAVSSVVIVCTVIIMVNAE